MTQANHACTTHERCEIDEDGTHWRLRLSYSRDERGNMDDFWSDDPWAAARVAATSEGTFCERGHQQVGGNYCGQCGAPKYESLRVRQ